MKSYQELEQHDIERDMFVVKSNALIQKSRYTQLNLEEQRILLYLISKITPDETKREWKKININEYCKVCGINLKDNKALYAYIKKTIKSLADKSFWILFEDNTERLLRWIDKAQINKFDGEVSVLLSDELMPYLIQLKKNYTQYRLLYVLTMKSKYSVRCYELFRSYLHQGKAYTEKIFEVDAFMRTIGIDNKTIETYLKNITMFKKNVLSKVLDEINTRTDINVSVEYRKEGRAIKELRFIIRANDKEEINMYRDYNELDAGLTEKRD
jgi:plasmid replication initiation protein